MPAEEIFLTCRQFLRRCMALHTYSDIGLYLALRDCRPSIHLTPLSYARHMKKLFVTILLILITSSSLATKAVVVGHGASSCGRWLKIAKGEEIVDISLRVSMVSWIQGYLSGLNSARSFSNKEMWNLPDFDSIHAFTNKACGDNPLNNLLGVAFQLQVSLLQTTP